MSDLNNKKLWIKIDDNHEEFTKNGIRFVREINDTPLPLDCPICKKLINCIEDVEMLKKENCCESCYDMYYFTNKEKWDNGWRPNI